MKFQYEPKDLVVHKKTAEVFRVVEVKTTHTQIEGRNDTSEFVVCDPVTGAGQDRLVLDFDAVRPYVHVFAVTGNNVTKIAMVAISPNMYFNPHRDITAFNNKLHDAAGRDNYHVAMPEIEWIEGTNDGVAVITERFK